MPNFLIIAPEPHELTETFQTVVRAKNKSHARKYIVWLHCLYNNGKPLPVKIYPTCEDEKEDAMEWNPNEYA